MTDRIEPALSAEEWRYWSRDPSDIQEPIARACDTVSYSLHQKPERLIALANAALPDSDLRKITRAMVMGLRDLAGQISRDHGDLLTGGRWADEALLSLADALESYLPPEGA